MVSELCKNYAEQSQGPLPTTVATWNGPSSTPHPNRSVVDTNANTIFEIIRNISEYSTPPSSPQNTQEDVNMVPPHLIETPSFSLGLTQEENIRSAEPLIRQEVANVTTLSDVNVGDNIAFPQSSRKSKRQKTVPAALVHDYLCGPHIDSRLHRPQKSVFVCYEKREIKRKFNVLSDKLAQNLFINVGGLAVSSKEMLLMAERLRLFPAKVVDILIRLVRNYQKFSKTKKKESFKFPKGVLDFFGNRDASSRLGIRYYFPLNVGKKHWIGVCFDTSHCKLYVLDCNVALSNESSMGRYLNPFLQMLPYLARHFGNELGVQRVMPYKFDRPESVFQNANPADAGLIAVLLKVKHAVYDFEACRHLSAESVAEEGKSAAIMAFESKEKL
ncbi:hypothetical protein Bca4012_011466 [Brassica carinata]